ncbi:urokinase plasminogen activator surface receptor-like [Astyanax mexicanus]|uniref:Lymphocyte antigen 6B-like isoform X2 n=1 Tax=Astyanax mexicanus TaxID=7994 RepID=A0A8T2LE65_ASTMX|nr:urokinase plasminogen activator surface receptor-like [Astyanax mexicanus]KAG9269184.1 lymphocyte antigen 6B-like isoform X2 [Astyanax mexicanus]
MQLQVTLMLICLLFPEVRGLKCYQCIPVPPGTCTQTQVDCTDQCSSTTMVNYMAGIKQDVQIKKCATSPECVSGSMNLGAVKMSLNTKCCSTDFCNSQSVPALPTGSPNGRKCYTCDNNDCTGIVDCEGDEDHCVNIKSSAGNVKVTLKGCASRSVCTEGQASMSSAGVSGSVNCCQGNLCNGAERVNLSLFLLILGPLLSFIPFSSVPFSVFF